MTPPPIPPTIRAAVLQPGGSVATVTRATPPPTPGEVLLCVALAGVCGTDLELARGFKAAAQVGCVLGHEFVGVVARMPALDGGASVATFCPSDIDEAPLLCIIMTSIGTGYDLSTTTYSPDGRVFQIEYAQKAIENSGTAIGVSCKDGVVMAVEKVVVSKMLLATRARDECSSYKSVYDSPIPGHVLAERLANFAHVYTLYAYVRPFGCAALLGAHDDINGYQLYLVEPSGVSYRYFGAAVGKGKQAAKTALEKLDFKTLTCREAVKELAKIIVDVHDETKDKLYELEMCWVCEESKNKSQLVPQDLVDEARKAAEAAQDDDSDMDDDE
ncbi:hypothetical protein BU14_0052s0020 [Porphyra umbilicalis]|uniref:Proteasome alpha-type subunits domain-containing protein n=1 Tax=Porphyra umbilicalis TaxID=2786 RepID=A0A1X6PHN5_PORUM|nr:hypothetical protein BU14_0052s0020 [Porphyra umbilicalis]|eukprot:OSX80404.1 hypothetical protein BU14_0052s0020 [Porphyra umbilicalis]